MELNDIFMKCYEMNGLQFHVRSRTDIRLRISIQMEFNLYS